MLEFNHLGPRESLFKVQNILDVRTAELINRLIVVTDHAEIAILFRKQFDKAELHGVRVLILVHHDVAEALLIVGQHIRVCLEELHCFQEQIIKVQRIVLPKEILIRPITGGNACLEIIRRLTLVALTVYHFVFRGADGREHRSLPQLLRVYVQLLHDLPHRSLLVIRIVNAEVIVIADAVNEAAQYAHTARMESRNPYSLRPTLHERIHATPHLRRRLVRKCDCKDIPRGHLFLPNQISNAVG